MFLRSEVPLSTLRRLTGAAAPRRPLARGLWPACHQVCPPWSEYGTHQAVKVRFWPWLSIESQFWKSGSLFALKRSIYSLSPIWRCQAFFRSEGGGFVPKKHMLVPSSLESGRSMRSHSSGETKPYRIPLQLGCSPVRMAKIRYGCRRCIGVPRSKKQPPPWGHHTALGIFLL